MTLTTFLLARITEDENDAVSPPPTLPDPARLLAECVAKRQIVALAHEATGLDQTVDMERETGARSDSGVQYVGDRILRALALVYDGHPDFDPAWRL
ncbi:hypothetical protein KQI48_02775 [Cellulomonas hominis]|jgi:hypothetical protein|uniref:DUF6221 family protein n=1 Tax=Cellulomonas hominis TaxID=156981 RepID=UPI001444480E|nr:DUF6221 family protein [Cellulomonas hominis]MBU5421581.1 hypothetical protein [Cellulomonas hominis]NKY09905.1 hypothetical protein [Cellulomonas hominis]